MTNEELILHAAGVLKPRATTNARLMGDVSATLLTDKGNLYSGVCIDTGSGTGFCAEHSAIAAMVTRGEYRIAKIVAVWRDERDGKLYVLPPCGRCREFIRQIDEENLETEVVLAKDTSRKLKELLPYHEWPEPLEIDAGAVFGDEDERFGDPLSERTQVRRAGHVTLRPSAPWTPAVHALLRHLEAVGFPGSPRVAGTGFDAAGREMVEFVAGEVAQDRVWSEEGIHQLGRMLRDLHEATASFRPPPQSLWQDSFLRAAGPDAVVSHGDVGPWNVVARHGLPVALIDWELAGPVDRLNELANTGWLNTRLFDDGIENVAGLPSVEQRVRQLRVFTEGYDLPPKDRVQLAQRVADVAILSAASDAIEAKITPASSDAAWLAWGVAWRARSAAWLVRHRRLLDETLR